eukprot:COSAG06_NODE_14553_length_1147_cov_1.661260_2_plen_173_part_00
MHARERACRGATDLPIARNADAMVVEVTLQFRSPAKELGPTSFTRDREHAKERQLAAQSGQVTPAPRQVLLNDGRDRNDAPGVEAKRSVEAELLSGEGRGFALLPHESAVTDWHDTAQITSVYYTEVQDLVERVRLRHWASCDQLSILSRPSFRINTASVAAAHPWTEGPEH